MTTTVQPATIEARLGVARGEAAALRQEGEKLADDARLALYNSKPIDKINARRAEVTARIAELELLCSELERRLPAEQKAALELALTAAVARYEELDAVLSQKRSALVAAQVALDKAAGDVDVAARLRDANTSFTAIQNLRRHQAAYPHLWGTENA